MCLRGAVVVGREGVEIDSYYALVDGFGEKAAEGHGDRAFQRVECVGQGREEGRGDEHREGGGQGCAVQFASLQQVVCILGREGQGVEVASGWWDDVGA